MLLAAVMLASGIVALLHVNAARKQGYPVARLFHETTETVNRAICHQTPFAAELVQYDDETGRSVQRFYATDGLQERGDREYTVAKLFKSFGDRPKV